MVSHDHLWSAIRIYGHEPYVPFDRKDGLPFRDLAGVVLNKLIHRLVNGLVVIPPLAGEGLNGCIGSIPFNPLHPLIAF